MNKEGSINSLKIGLAYRDALTLDGSSPKQSAKRSGLVPSIEAHRRDTTG